MTSLQPFRLVPVRSDWVSSGRPHEQPDSIGSVPDDLALAKGLVSNAVLPADREATRHETLAFCDRHGDALHRSCQDGHLTASVFAVEPSSQTVLLIHHRKLERWLQPGGHADGEGNLVRVACSELLEETGLSDISLVLPAFDIDIHEIPARGDDPNHVHLDLRFVAIVNDKSQLAPDAAETKGADWVEADDLRLRATDVGVPGQRALSIVRGLG